MHTTTEAIPLTGSIVIVLLYFSDLFFDLMIIVTNILRCPSPNDKVELLQNGVSTSSRFSFSMFIFISNSTKIYLHCAIHLCLLKDNDCSVVSVQILSQHQMFKEYTYPSWILVTVFSCWCLWDKLTYCCF